MVERGVQMGGFPTSGGLVEYRGKTYVTRSGGAGFVGLVIPVGEGAADYLDGFKFGNTDGIRWVNTWVGRRLRTPPRWKSRV